MNLDISQFNFKQIFNNSKGKTSLALLICFIFAVAAALGFVSCGIVLIFETHKDSATKADVGSYSMQCVALAGLVVTVLMGRRFTEDKQISNENNEIK